MPLSFVYFLNGPFKAEQIMGDRRVEQAFDTGQILGLGQDPHQLGDDGLDCHRRRTHRGSKDNRKAN